MGTTEHQGSSDWRGADDTTRTRSAQNTIGAERSATVDGGAAHDRSRDVLVRTVGEAAARQGDAATAIDAAADPARAADANRAADSARAADPTCPAGPNRAGAGDAASNRRVAGPRRRIISLDVARGLMLVVSVAVNAWITAPAWFEHAPWEGVHPIDLVFPTFVALSGVGLAFANARRVPLQPMLHRVGVLTLAGLAYTAHAQYLATGELDVGSFRVLGVLQLYAALVLLVALVHLVLRRWWAWPVFTIALAAGYAYALGRFAVTCPTQTLTPQCNPSGVIDPAVFGAKHIFHQGRFGHDPEGLVALIGALVVASAGASIGHLLRSSRLSTARLTGVGVLMLAVFAGVATASAGVAPPMKRLWTPAFGLGVATGCGVVLLLLYLALDRPGRSPRGRVTKAATYPLIALGRNSLLVYFGSHVLMTTLVLLPHDASRTDSLAARLAATAPAGIDQAPWLVLLAVAAWTALACLLHRHGLYLRPSGGFRRR